MREEDATLIEVRTRPLDAGRGDDEPTLVQEVNFELLELTSRAPLRDVRKRTAVREEVTIIHSEVDPRTPIVKESTYRDVHLPGSLRSATPRSASLPSATPPSATLPSARRARKGQDRQPGAVIAKLPARWTRWVPKNLGGAMGLGAAVGLVGSGLAVGLCWALSLGPGSSEQSVAVSSREAEVVASVVTQSGRPVAGATIDAGDIRQTSDAVGRATLAVRLAPGRAQVLSLGVECPEGHSAREERRSLKWLAPESPGASFHREVTFFCEVNSVEVRLELQIRGGEAHFWLGERDLGVSENGILQCSVRVAAHSEQVLIVEPLLAKGQTRRPKISGDSPTFHVDEVPRTFAHTLELAAPKRARAKPTRIPYRL